MRTAILLCSWIVSSTCAAEMVSACDVGAKSRQRVEVTREARLASTYVYYLRQGRQRVPFFETAEQSRGESVLVQCVGKSQRVLIVSGEFTANALQGFVVSYPSTGAGLKRLDFAEKSRPIWLYLSASQVMVVSATFGYGETDAKYVVYRHVVGLEDQTEAVNELPPVAGFERVKLSTAVK